MLNFRFLSFIFQAAPRPVIEDIKPPPWHKPVDFRIISLVFNRASSLKRQLDSLNTAEYFGDNVLVEIWIDRSKKDGKIDPKTYLVAKNFTFKYGDVRVHNHTRHVGLYGQWFGTWNPDPKSKEIAVFLEDDVSVSPLFYRWLKNVHKKYYRRTDVAGYSLRGTCPRYRGPYVDIRAPETEFCMLYRATGTSDDMWTMWHIYYTHVNNQYTLFLNFPNKAGLTSHWQEGGLHFSKHQTLKKSAPLLTKWDPKYEHLPDKLVKLDYDGTIIK
ncbi:hypothetical protein FSP39_004315 [Pinctada imbricata]|uniref:Uncharacterized protein n=1 Tax=Pinctada imbricata TaxID=66713 RepID=A0AA88Y819_PINIB|nr:hypothetical protein FSP39_004315 [Pinctada imbricata]